MNKTSSLVLASSLVPACFAPDALKVGSDTSGSLASSSDSESAEAESLSSTFATMGETSTPTGAEETSGVGSICGDGHVDEDEVCDDGVNDGGYGGCLPDCSGLGPRCGDAIDQLDESCDDGDQINGNGCNVDCVASGSVRWTETIDMMAEIRGLAVLPEDDEFVAVGSAGGAAWIRRYTANAGTVWTTTYDGPKGDDRRALTVATDADGQIYAAGYYGTTIPSTMNGWIRKYDGAGNAGYLHTFDSVVGSSDDKIHGVDVDNEGYAVVVGQADPDDRDIWVRRLGQDGSEFWTRSFDAGQGDYATAVALDSAGSIVVVGTISGETLSGWIRKYNSDGGTLWTEMAEATQYAYPRAVAVDAVGHIVLAGTLDNDGWVQQRDEDGDTLWTDTFNSEKGSTDLESIATDSDGNIVVVGYSTDANYYRSMFVRKYTADGTVLWTHEGLIGMAKKYGSALAWSVAIDSAQNVIVGGGEQLDDTRYAWIRKFAP